MNEDNKEIDTLENVETLNDTTIDANNIVSEDILAQQPLMAALMQQPETVPETMPETVPETMPETVPETVPIVNGLETSRNNLEKKENVEISTTIKNDETLNKKTKKVLYLSF